MTDINKQIEEEAREYRRKLIQKIRLNKANVDYILENGLINGSLMLDIDKAMIDYQKYSSRWRKVSERLPKYGDIVVAKGDTSDFQDMYLIEIDSDYSMSVLTSYYKEWKPID